MRLSRNRNWGHPDLVEFLKRLAPIAARDAGWPGILGGDLSQPRGGPMLTGHVSHQIGLDADIWLLSLPERVLTRDERELLSCVGVVRQDRLDFDPRAWTRGHVAVLRAAAMDPGVQRIFVNPAIKRALCRAAAGAPWLGKLRPERGHDSHFHVRLLCPGGSSCTVQEPIPPGDGCDDTLEWWFTDEALHPKDPPAPRPPITMADLPERCREVLSAQ
jgi:penicillin-insensitive murein endopeptidase